jgi:hypothetical protein
MGQGFLGWRGFCVIHEKMEGFMMRILKKLSYFIKIKDGGAEAEKVFVIARSEGPRHSGGPQRQAGSLSHIPHPTSHFCHCEAPRVLAISYTESCGTKNNDKDEMREGDGMMQGLKPEAKLNNSRASAITSNKMGQIPRPTLTSWGLALLVMLTWLFMVSSSFAVETWSESTLGTTKILNGVTYGNGLYVAVGHWGTIMTSPDGTTWSGQTSDTRDHLLRVTYGNGSFVAVGWSGTILTSPDGTTWTARASGTTNAFRGVTYVNNLFVAVGDSGKMLTSPDGITWTARASGTTNSLFGVTYGNELYVAVGASGTIMTSPDGTTWTGRTSGTRFWLYGGVTYGNGLYVAVGGSGTILTSPDATTWTARISPNTNALRGVTYGNGLYVAVGDSGRILTSPDGITWTALPFGGWFNDITYVDNFYVAVGSWGTILTSSDGIAWTTQISGIHFGVTYGSGLFVAVGWSGKILTSPDGTTWMARTSGTTNAFRGVTYGNGLYVAVGGSGTILTSLDGITWTARTSPNTNSLYGVTYGNELYVAVGDSGTIMTSPDGTTWTGRTSGTTNFLSGVTYGNGLYVAVGDSGRIMTSPDGITWTARSSSTTQHMRNVTYGSGLFVAVGSWGTILTSPDATTWTERTSGTTNVLRGVTYGNGLYVAVGDSGRILSSPDGITWTARTSPNTNSLCGVTYGNDLYVAVADSAGILTSQGKANPTVSVTNTTKNEISDHILNVSNIITRIEDKEKILQIAEETIAKTNQFVTNDKPVTEIYTEVKKFSENILRNNSTFKLISLLDEGVINAKIGNINIDEVSKISRDIVSNNQRLNRGLESSNLGLQVRPSIYLNINGEREQIKRTIVEIPINFFSELKNNEIDYITITSPIAEIRINQQDLKQITSDIVFDAKIIHNSIADNAYEFDIKSSGESIQHFSNGLLIKIPYELKKDDNINNLTVFYLDENGQISNEIGFYDAINNTVNFKTNYLSTFFIKSNLIEFNDIDDNWAKNIIENLASKGILAGFENNDFRPMLNVTRAEFVTMIINVFKLPLVEYNNNFKDVSKDVWYSDFVATAYENNIITGYEDATFKPTHKITREEMVTITMSVMSNFINFKTTNNLSILNSNFNDYDEIHNFATQSVSNAYRYGIISGLPTGDFNPKGNATRAEAAAVIYKILNFKFLNSL